MLSKNTCEGVHFLVQLPAIGLQACKFTKTELLRTYFWRILARFSVITYCAFLGIISWKGASRCNGWGLFFRWWGASFLSGGHPMGGIGFDGVGFRKKIVGCEEASPHAASTMGHPYVLGQSQPYNNITTCQFYSRLTRKTPEHAKGQRWLWTSKCNWAHWILWSSSKTVATFAPFRYVE